MLLSDTSVKRPVFATVLSLLLIVIGIVAFDRLALREYPDIDPPIVSVEVTYPGAAAVVVESRITQVIEERIAGIEGIKYITSTSEDGRSTVTIEFTIERDVDSAANDVRDRVSTAVRDLPDEADPPEISKVDANADPIMWLNLSSSKMTVLELTDYAARYLEDRFAVLDGVARVRLGGGLEYAMRIWLDRNALAARNLTVGDVEEALRSENVELPAGSIESDTRQFTARILRTYRTPADFNNLVIGRGDNGYLVRLSDVARVELDAQESRTLFRGNGEAMIGIGIIKQSTANTLAVARLAREEANRLNPTLPEGMTIDNSYDSSVFIEASINEVYITLGIAIALVVFVIWLFLGSWRAMLIPAFTVPVSLIATFIVLFAFGYSLNLLTLLALVLAIGMVVDDAIVMLENIHRRIELGEPPLLAAYNGAREVSFAVVATTLVLMATFVPITFLQGTTGKLFSEFAITMAAAVGFSSIVALTLTPMMCSKWLTAEQQKAPIDGLMRRGQTFYERSLKKLLSRYWLVGGAFIALIGLTAFILMRVPSEFTPQEDRGVFFLIVNGPEGASYDYMEKYMTEIEKRMMPLVESGEISRLLIRAPRSFGSIASFNTGIVIAVLNDWSERRSGWTIIEDVQKSMADLPGVTAFPVMRQGLSRGFGKPVQFVLGGSSFEELTKWRDILMEAAANEPSLAALDSDYKETKPQLEITIRQDRAADLGVTVADIGRTLESMLGSRRVTTFIDRGEEYDVLVEGERANQNTPADMKNIYVRSRTSNQLIPLSNLVEVREIADAATLNRYNRVRAITIEANIGNGYTLGDALDTLERLARENLPAEASIDYKNESLEFKESSGNVGSIFILSIVIVFLILAAQFESFVHPLVIILSVPLAIGGALIGLWLTDGTLNIYSQIGLIMLVGLSAKNGILIVEFINQARDRGMAFNDAIIYAAQARLRPIMMTGITTAAGAIPLLLATGAGAETRITIGIVVFTGVLVGIFFTLFLIPVAYRLLAKGTGSPERIAQELQQLQEQHESQPHN